MDLRLLLFEYCNRKCRGCCNKYFDLKNLEICESFKEYDKILLTGGEPMISPSFVKSTIKLIRMQTNAPIILYTAKTDDFEIFEILEMIDGITVTLHVNKDVKSFNLFNINLSNMDISNKSLRLNVFNGVNIKYVSGLSKWSIKKNIKWIKNCPLPENEVFKRLS